MRVPVKKYILKAKIGGRLICEVGLYASIYGNIRTVYEIDF
jgi:hypothetical protein